MKGIKEPRLFSLLIDFSVYHKSDSRREKNLLIPYNKMV